MATRATTWFALVLAVAAIFIASTSSSPDVCEYFDMDGYHPARDPIAPHHGKVVAVVLGRASRYVSLQLVRKLESSMIEMHDMGMKETALVVVAEKERGNHIKDWRRRVRLAKLQTDSIDGALFRAFKGRTNDVLVYDRCGRMTYFIPYTKKNSNFLNEWVDLISRAIIETYTNNICKEPCRTDESEEEDIDPLQDLLNQVNKTTVAPVKEEPETTTSRKPITPTPAMPPPMTTTSTPTTSKAPVPPTPDALDSTTPDIPVSPTPGDFAPSTPDAMASSTPDALESSTPCAPTFPTYKTPTSMLGYVWSYVKAIFTLRSQENELCVMTTAAPSSGYDSNDNVNPTILSKEEACERLGSNPCESVNNSSRTEEEDAFCCDAIQFGFDEENCNHTQEYCNWFLLKKICCAESISKY